MDDRNRRALCAVTVCSMIGLLAPPAQTQTVEDWVTSILSRMTIEEKILQLHQEGGMNTADNPRLGVPGFVMADGPHGVRDGSATSFPVSIGIAATWDRGLAQRVGVALGEEFRGKGKHQMLGPSMDLDRDPRNGRGPETGGEDPYLCAQITTAVVRGVQSTGCIATAKHYNCNAREDGRTTNDVTISRRLLEEEYGLHFRSAVQEGGAFCVMNAYTLVNGLKSAESPVLLTQILRDDWGFPFYVVSDWGSIWSSENAIKAGCDVCMGSSNYQDDLPGLVSSGAVPVGTLDNAVRRVLRTKILAGMLDYYPQGNPGDVNSVAHQELCLEAGRKSIVLLKNQGGILPLDAAALTSVALIGPNANVLQIDGGGSSYVTPFYTVTPLQGIGRIIGGAKLHYVKGCDVNSADTSGFAAAASAASAADVVIYVGGLDVSQEGEGSDRAGGSIDLPGKQQDLVNRLAGVNKNVVVVLFSGGVCGLNRCVGNIAGLLQAFYPGQEGGNAIADVLFGVSNPGGRLPVTWPKTDAQLPVWNDNFNDDNGCGYRWFDAMALTPQFAFGFGLSYTTFSYSNLLVTPARAAMGSHVQVSVDVTNTGTRGGDEVAQLYLTDVSSSVPMAAKALKGFQRVSLNPGQTTTVTFTLTPEELFYYDEGAGRFDVEPGTFTVRVGGSSDNLPLAGNFEVLDGTRKPDLRISWIKTVPPFPVPGDSVVFLAMVRNQGVGATSLDALLKVSFAVDGVPLSLSDDFIGSIPAGGMALVCANRGSAGGNNRWIAGATGAYTISGAVDPDQTIDEGVEDNNTASAQLQVFPPPPLNLALHRPVTVTSVEGAGLEGEKAVDGSMGTRWSSAFSDPQTITVDLGSIFNVTQVILRWEAAYAKSYAVLASDNGTVFTPIFYQTNGKGGADTVVCSTNARYLRMTGLSRATSYGYSLYEFEVYGPPLAGVAPVASALPTKFALRGNYPNPFNPSTTVGFDLPHTARVSLVVYDLLGRRVATLVDGPLAGGTHMVIWNAGGAASGVYFCRMIADGFSDVKKFLLQK